MPRKTSLYLDDATETILAERAGVAAAARAHGRRSLLLREVVRRYDELCRLGTPKLRTTDWNFLFSDGLIPGAADSPPQAIAATLGLLLEACHRSRRTGLARRLAALSYGERIALVDALERRRVTRVQAPPAPPISS